MGNCCNDRHEEPLIPPSESKESSSLLTPHPTRPLSPPKEAITGSVISTNASETKEMRDSEPMRTLKDLVAGLERLETVPSEQVRRGKEWMGAIDIHCAQTAIEIGRVLQSREFGTNPLIRLGYYTLFKEKNVFLRLLEGLKASQPCVRYSFAQLLEVILTVFMNLTFNITHDLVALDVFPRLEVALQAVEPEEFYLCVSNIVHCMYYRNGYIQSVLTQEIYHSLVSELVKLMTKLRQPGLICRHAENVSDFARRYDGERMGENWQCLQFCGLFEAITNAMVTLQSAKGGSNDAEISRAGVVLSQLLAHI